MTEQYYDYLEELFEKKIADKKLKSILFDILKDGMKEKNQNPEETQLQIAGEQVLVYLKFRDFYNEIYFAIFFCHLQKP